MKNFTFLNRMLFLFISSLFLTASAFSQGTEDFEDLPTNNSTAYQARTWTGTDGVVWTAEGARTDQTINGKAICWGNSGPRNVISPTYSNGMGILNFSYVRGFTGTGARSLEVYVNNDLISTITVSPTSNEVIVYSEAIEVSGDVVLEIRSTGSAQVKVDDISWTSFGEGDPTISATPLSLTGFIYPEGSGPSDEQSISVAGNNLEDDLIITPPANYEISLSSGAGFSINPIVIGPDEGVVELTDIFVRLAGGLTGGEYTGNIVLSSDGASDVTVSVSGSVVGEFEVPYFNAFRTAVDQAAAIEVGFVLSGTTQQTAAGGYQQIPLDAYIETPTINFTNYEAIAITLSLATFGGNAGQTLGIEISDNNGADYDLLTTFTPGSSTHADFEYEVDLTDYNVETGKLRFRMISGSNSIRFRDMNLEEAFLPIDLLSFNATPKEGKVLLSWTYENAVDFEKFVVEHSASDRGWTEIAYVELSDNNAASARSNSAEAVHHDPVNGANYYRLKMVDLDGTYRYSKAEAVNMTKKGKVSVMNNLVEQRIHLVNEGGYDHILVRFSDMQGRYISEQVLNEAGGMNDIFLDAEGFQGMFIMTIVAGGEMSSFRMVKR